jgi:hypothetical protein
MADGANFIGFQRRNIARVPCERLGASPTCDNHFLDFVRRRMRRCRLLRRGRARKYCH